MAALNIHKRASCPQTTPELSVRSGVLFVPPKYLHKHKVDVAIVVLVADSRLFPACLFLYTTVRVSVCGCGCA